jgi:tetratricopeptide (TPR) repeat protein
MSQINAIFIFCSNKPRHEKWAKDWSKIVGVFTEINDLLKAIKEAIIQYNQNLISISFTSTSGLTSKQNLDQLDPSYMYTQILKEILFQIDFDKQHIKDFIKYCREAFAANDRELKNCKKIEEEYHNHTPIWWYTYECFLYSMLNRALRLMDVHIIIKMGFFIQDLCQQIEQLHSEQFNGNQKPYSFTVYRDQVMSKAELDQLMKTKGGLLSFNNFLLSIKDRALSLDFAKRSQITSDLVSVLFVMTIDPSISSTPFACIGDTSYCQDSNNEVLFSMHSVFRIGDIKQIDNYDCLWQVDLILTSDDDQQLNTLTKYIREEIQGPTGWHRLGKFLLKLGHFNEAEEVYKVLLSRTKDNREESILCDQLGMVKNSQREYGQAITFCEKALEIKQSTLALNHPDLAQSYNNIGLVNANMGEYSKALSWYEKGLKIQQKTLRSNHPDLAQSFSHIGLVYANMGEYSKALSSHEKALEIRQNILPSNHPDLAHSFSKIGLIYASMGEYSKAFSWYEKALEIRQNTLPRNHPDLVESYNNIGFVYASMREYSKALSFHEKALEIRRNSLTSNHPDLVESYNNIGFLYASMREYSKALSYHERALEIGEKALPSNHPKLAETYYNIGSVFENMHKYWKAVSFCKKAVEIGQRSLVSNHPDLERWQKTLEIVKKNC